jgi:hypothetical protein
MMSIGKTQKYPEVILVQLGYAHQIRLDSGRIRWFGLVLRNSRPEHQAGKYVNELGYAGVI